MCPPEGDAGTGMTATNSVTVRTGNVSAGTSVFAMLVLENELKGVHREIDMVTTPAGDPVAMVHCNNCTSDLNAWVGLFAEFLEDDGDGCGQKPTVRNSLQKGNGGRGRRRADCFPTDTYPENILRDLKREGQCLYVHRIPGLIWQILCVSICIQHLEHLKQEWTF